MKTIRNIVHISESRINLSGGMGRIEYYWKEKFLSKGYNFIHIGPDEIGVLNHRSLFGVKAYSRYIKMHIKADLFIVHEPIACYFLHLKVPCILESHGLERRWHNIVNRFKLESEFQKSLKSQLFSKVRSAQCDIGVKMASKLLLSNSDDVSFAIKNYKRNRTDIFQYKNGVNILNLTRKRQADDFFTILFNGSFIKRKGTHTLINAIKLFVDIEKKVRILLVGTGKSESEVLLEWPSELRHYITVVPSFDSEQEKVFLTSADVFVLPSFFEGQPLSLLQAMASGLCCITTNCCGQKDIIIDGFNGFLIEPGDSQMLADKLIELKNDPTTRLQIGLNAVQSMLNRTWSNCSDEVVRFVEQSLK